jgi:hypothetical protein
MSENAGASTSRSPKGLHGLYRDSFTFLPYITELTLPHLDRRGEVLINAVLSMKVYIMALQTALVSNANT